MEKFLVASSLRRLVLQATHTQQSHSSSRLRAILRLADGIFLDVILITRLIVETTQL